MTDGNSCIRTFSMARIGHEPHSATEFNKDGFLAGNERLRARHTRKVHATE